MLSITSKLNVKLLSSLAISSLLLFSACSSDGDSAQGDNGVQNDSQNSASGSKEGKFMDSGVEGIAYVTDSRNGNTDSDGKFLYNANDKYISFSVGKLIIKKDFDLSKLNADGIIFPSDMLGTEKRGNTSNKALVNLLRVLHSIDNDSNVSNGIFISNDIKDHFSQSMNITDVSTLELKKMLEDAEKTFTSQRKARRHYIQTLIKNNIEPELMPFITVWKTHSSDDSITIQADGKYTYNYTVDWGDGNIDKNMTNSKAHTYDTAGKYTVKITGNFPHFLGNFGYQGREYDLQLVTQWGDIAWKDFSKSFRFCSNVDINATDTPDLTNVNSTVEMFRLARKLIGNEYFNDWDVSSVTNMRYMFCDAKAFNQPLNNWNVSNVTDMYGLFSDAFNQPLNKWDVSKVTNMSYMFNEAKAFTNQDLSSWNVGNVPSNKHNYFMDGSGGGNTEPNWNK
jgi:surface protein